MMIQGRALRPLLFLFLLLFLGSKSSAQEEGAEMNDGAILHDLGFSFLFYPDWRGPHYLSNQHFLPYYRFWYERLGVQVGFTPFHEDLNDGRHWDHGVMLDLHFQVTKGNMFDLLAYQGNSLYYKREPGYCVGKSSKHCRAEERLRELSFFHHRLGLGVDVILVDRVGMTLIGSVSSSPDLNDFLPMAKASFYYRL